MGRVESVWFTLVREWGTGKREISLIFYSIFVLQSFILS